MNKRRPRSKPKPTKPAPVTGPAGRDASTWWVGGLCFLLGVGGGAWGRHALRTANAEPQAVQERPESSAPASPTTKANEQEFGVHFRRGYALRAAERHAQALTEFELAVAAAPNLAEGHFLLAETYASLQRGELAEQGYRAALRCDANFRPAEEKLCMLLIERGRHAEAETLLESMRRATPHDAFVMGELGLNALNLGDTERAVKFLELYAAERPNDAWGRAHLGRAYDLANNAPRAEQQFRLALEANRHFAVAYHWLGLLLARLDRTAEAKAAMAEHQRLRQLEVAEHQLHMALLRSDSDVATLTRLVEVRLQLGKRQEAGAALQRALQLAPQHAELLRLKTELAP